MKILTKEEEEAHYNATLKGGVVGGAAGLTLSTAAIYLGSRRIPTIHSLTLPFRVFLVASSATFASIVNADRASRGYEVTHNAERLRLAQRRSDLDRYAASQPVLVRAKRWAADNRYSLVFASWLASMGIALALVRRNPYLSPGQKLVQSRIYAQGLTLALLLASFGLEGLDAAKKRGRWEIVKVLDPDDPLHQRLIEKRIHHEKYQGEDQWMEVIAAEEARLKERRIMHEKELATLKQAQAKAHDITRSTQSQSQSQSHPTST